MEKQKKLVLCGIAVVLMLLVGIFLLLSTAPTPEKRDQTEEFYLAERNYLEIQSIRVKNRHGGYDVEQMDGGFSVGDLPSDCVNGDYLKLLLDESSRIAVSQVAAEKPETLDIYGLQEPQAEVQISYTDGSSLSLLLGTEEKLSDSVYVKVKGEEPVYLMSRSYTIRYTMPVENYIQFEITPMRELPSALAVVKEASFSGTALPEAIHISAVDAMKEEQMRTAASFGAATHLVTAPVLHEMDQDYGDKVFQSMLGLMSEGIVAYNCSEEELAEYGFAQPYLQVDFTIVNGADAKPEQILLKIVKLQDGSLIATCNDSGIVYRILEVPFTQITYEKLVLRWFLTPFITDIDAMKVTIGERTDTYKLEGDNKTLSVNKNGKALEAERFRAFYRLAVSACNDGTEKRVQPAAGEPLLSIEYIYKDKKKKADVLRLYELDARKVLAQVNGIGEFSMNRSFVERMTEATEALDNGTKINEAW